MSVETATVLIAGVRVVFAAIISIISSRRADEQRQVTLEAQQRVLETRQAQLVMQVYKRVRFQYSPELRDFVLFCFSGSMSIGCNQVLKETLGIMQICRVTSSFIHQ